MAEQDDNAGYTTGFEVQITFSSIGWAISLNCLLDSNPNFQRYRRLIDNARRCD